MNKKEFKLRKAYASILYFIIFFLYPLRSMMLYLYPNSYELGLISYVPYKHFSFEKLPVIYIAAGIVLLLLSPKIFPRNIALCRVFSIKLFKWFFYFQNLTMILVPIFTGYGMGTQMTAPIRMLMGLVDGIIGRSFVFILILIDAKIKNNKIGKYFLFYTIPSIFIGSKAGFIIALMIYIFIKIGFGEKIIDRRILILGLFGYFIYPLIYYFSWAIRAKDISSFRFVSYDVLTPLELISRRVSGIDIFMANKANVINISDFSSFMHLYNIFSALFTRGLMSFISQTSIEHYGLLFTENVFHQPIGITNAFEPTLLGVFYYSENTITSFLIITCCFILLLISFRKLSKNYMYILYIPLCLELILLVMTGNYPNFFITFRYYFIFICIESVLKKISLGVKSNEKSINY